MKGVFAGGWELLAIAWRASRSRVVISFALMLLQWAALPLSAPALRDVTDAVIGGTRRNIILSC